MKQTKRKTRRQKISANYVKPPESERKEPFRYSARFNAWFERVRRGIYGSQQL